LTRRVVEAAESSEHWQRLRGVYKLRTVVGRKAQINWVERLAKIWCQWLQICHRPWQRQLWKGM